MSSLEINSPESAPPSPRRRRTLAGTALRLVVLGVVVAGAVGMWLVVTKWSSAKANQKTFRAPPIATAGDRNQKSNNVSTTTPTQTPTSTPTEATPQSVGTALSPAESHTAEAHVPVHQMLESLEDGIVKIETGDAADTDGLG